MTSDEKLHELLAEWRDGLPSQTRKAIGTYFGVLIVLDRLSQQHTLDLSDQSLFTPNGARISGQNAQSVQRILNQFDRGFEVNSIGGRTSPGPALAAKALLTALQDYGVEQLPAPKQLTTLGICNHFMREQIQSICDQEKTVFEYDLSLPLQAALSDLLDRYEGTARVRAVAQHLVGAKLELRFPDEDINRDSVDAADLSGGKLGDFQINDFVFHVTVSPGRGHIDKCVANIRSNLKPMLIVPQAAVPAVRVYASEHSEYANQIQCRTFEGFVSQNIEELSTFKASAIKEQVTKLLYCYNDRIRIAEPGKPYLEIEWR
ncbi:MAG: DUF4928 family protein [Phycisphaerales bacterium]|nr:DUF4928 family protein [Phycisphaerales bacterium]